MLAVQLLVLAILLLVIPTAVGSLLLGVDRRVRKLPFAWISGQMLLWAGFQVITVPLILKEASFTLVVYLFWGYTALLLFAALVCYIVKKKKGTFALRAVEEKTEKSKTYYIMWSLFWALLIFQFVQAFRLAYADGDDAFYVAVSTSTESSNAMYRVNAYTGLGVGLDARYGLAPFPVWIAFLARVCGIRTVSVAQVFVPPVMIAMAYGVFYLLGSKLFAHNRERLPLFMVFVELLMLFGNYSIYTAERFLLERSRQGKAALSGIVIPMLLFLLMLLLEKIQDNQKIRLSFWVSMLSTLTAACLCSTLGTVLTCVLVGCTGLCAAITYRKWKFLLPLAGCCIPCMAVALLYVMH